MGEPEHSLHVCHECDAVQALPRVPVGAVARCVCCDAKLWQNQGGTLDAPLALMLATSILFLIANLSPLLTLELQGSAITTTVFGTALSLWRADLHILSLFAWFATVIGPGLVIFSGFYTLFSLRFSLRLPGVRWLLVALSLAMPWVMLDVFLLGVIVSLVKLLGMAGVVPGVGLYAFLLLIFAFAGSVSQMDSQRLWQHYERQHGLIGS